MPFRANQREVLCIWAVFLDENNFASHHIAHITQIFQLSTEVFARGTLQQLEWLLQHNLRRVNVLKLHDFDKQLLVLKYYPGQNLLAVFKLFFLEYRESFDRWSQALTYILPHDTSKITECALIYLEDIDNHLHDKSTDASAM